MKHKSISDFKIGNKASLTKTFTESEVISFSKLSCDDNPIHFDIEYASNSRFKHRIVQGPYVLALIGGLLGSKLPGPGSIYINQQIHFLAPIFIGDRIKVEVEIISIREDKPIIKLKTRAIKENIVMDGEATILFING